MTKTTFARIIAPACLLAMLGSSVAYAHHDDKALALEKQSLRHENASLAHLQKALAATSLAAAKPELKLALATGKKSDTLAYQAIKITKDHNAVGELYGAVYMLNSANYELIVALSATKMSDMRSFAQQAQGFGQDALPGLKQAIKDSGK